LEKSENLAQPPPQSRLAAQFRRLGPGFVYALTVLGTGDLVSNSAAGAGYGYALIWAVAMTVVFRFVWISASAKYVLVTGESLLQGYARVGRWVIWIILVAIIIIGHFDIMTQIVMTGRGANLLFPLPTQWSATIWSICFTLLGFVMVFWGGYRVIETFCKVLIAVMGGSLVVVAVISRPDPAEIVRGALIPTIPGSEGLYGSFFVLMALIGTGVGSTSNLTYAYFIREKGWRDISYLKQQRVDLIFGLACMFVMGALLQVAAAATIHPLGIDLEDADDMVRIFSEVQGLVGLIIFGLGLGGASFSTLVGIITGYALVITDISRFLIPSLGKSPEKEETRKSTRRHPVYRACVIFWSFSPLYILFTGVNPVWLVLSVNALFAVLIPLLTPVLLKITNDKSLMGQHRNSWLTNTILVFLVLVAIYLTYKNVIEPWF
jgi:Mn2+/Fe2+ NRAMP family transporter